MLRRPFAGVRCLRPPIVNHHPHPLQPPRRHISALYVTGDKANQTYAALTPYFDFKTRLGAASSDVAAHERLAADIRARGASAARIDVDQLLQLWSVFRTVQQRKRELEQRRSAIADEIKAMQRAAKSGGAAAPDADWERKLRSDGVLCRDDLKRLKENSYALEDRFVHEFLALPNELHARTPHGEPTVLFSQLTEQVPSVELGAPRASHLHSAAGAHLIDYRSAYCYYLLDAAADFELAVCTHFANAFRLRGFVRTSNPDFARSLLAEAAGSASPEAELLTVVDDGAVDGEADETSHINCTHLAGAGSALAFLGYFAKLAPFESALPLRLVATGRTYGKPTTTTTATDTHANDGLYGVAQRTTVQTFQAAATAADAERFFDETLAALAEEYSRFRRPVRIVQVPASGLRAAEAMRADVEMWTRGAGGGAWRRVADVAYYGEWISKRLLFSYKETGGSKSERRSIDDGPRFGHLVSSTAVDAQRLLAVLLEPDGPEAEAKFRVPDFLVDEHDEHDE